MKNQSNCLGYSVSFWGDEVVLELDHGVGYPALNTLKTMKLYISNGWISYVM